MDAIKDMTCVMRDNQEFNHFSHFVAIVRYHNQKQWFCVITHCAYLDNKNACTHLSIVLSPIFKLGCCRHFPSIEKNSG